MIELEDYQGSWGDFHTWWADFLKNKVVRVLLPGCEVYSHYFVDQGIELGGGDYLLGLSKRDESKEYFRIPHALEYYRLSEIRLSWDDEDSNEEGV